MSTIYRKYRPQTFADMHDQEHIITTLTNEISSGKIAHAYLFTGPRGVGKTTTARLLAKALNCPNRKKDSFEPCNECSSCSEITAGRNIDVIEIDAASHTGVDNVRENIIDNAQFKPTRSPYKIFIIDEVHMLSGSAFNALLKTIEEPPAHVILILATTELQKLPATIISRCQRFGFKKIIAEEMLKKLEMICKQEKIKVDKEVLNKIIIKSEGGLRDAESLLGQIFSLNLKEINDNDVEAILPSADFGAVLEFLSSLIDSNVAGAIEQINIAANSGANLEQFTLSLIDILRSMLIAQTGYDIKNIINTDKDTFKQIKELSTKLPTQKIITMIESAVMRKREIKQAPVLQLPLELFAVEFGSKISVTSNTTIDGVITTKIETKNETKSHNITESIKTAISSFTHKSVPKSTLEEVKAKWSEVVSNISKTVPSLTFILKMCSLNSVAEDGLHIAFNFEIHKDKVGEIKNKKMIEDELEKVLGERIKIICEFTENKSADSANDKELNNLASEFGGEVI
ncbi:MAG: DNA polymerase III subunit gamma/tau [Candidatus Magasanikbacteria bacterium]|nr:DNA polymerase III subunit gamma/tau [Candidatus Magasanikbacteria bacterium]